MQSPAIESSNASLPGAGNEGNPQPPSGLTELAEPDAPIELAEFNDSSAQGDGGVVILRTSTFTRVPPCHSARSRRVHASMKQKDTHFVCGRTPCAQPRHGQIS